VCFESGRQREWIGELFLSRSGVKSIVIPPRSILIDPWACPASVQLWVAGGPIVDCFLRYARIGGWYGIRGDPAGKRMPGNMARREKLGIERRGCVEVRLSHSR
jgi:hypothetical protein